MVQTMKINNKPFSKQEIEMIILGVKLIYSTKSSVRIAGNSVFFGSRYKFYVSHEQAMLYMAMSTCDPLTLIYLKERIEK